MSKYDLQSSTAYLYVLQNGFTNLGDHPKYYEPFIEFFIEECRESDRGYFFGSQKYIIDLWWDHNKDLYETKTPYI